METTTATQPDFIPYPTNRVVGTVADDTRAHAAIEALLQDGFDPQDIDILHGEADVQRLDPTGTKHGFLARFQRTLIRTVSPAEEHKHLMHHIEDVRGGRFVIMVLAKKREQRVLAADILNAHGAEFIGFYGRWAWEGFSPATAASQSEPPNEDEAKRPIVTRPEQIPYCLPRRGTNETLTHWRHSSMKMRSS